MDSDFSIRNELDSVVRGSASDSDKYKVENPFSKLVDAFQGKQNSTSSTTSASAPPHEDSGWRAQAIFASSIAQQQADVAHRAIDLMHRSLAGVPQAVNYWKYIAITSVGLLILVLLIYWKSNTRLQLVTFKSTDLAD